MEEGINFGRYFFAIRKWYRLIILVPLLLGLGALAVSFAVPPSYEAEADLAIVKSGAVLNFDPKFQTISETQLTQQAIDQTARRKSLTTMAKTSDLAAAVSAKLGSHLDDAQRFPDRLLAAVTAVNDGDLIKITARAKSAEEAALIANTWAEEYASRVNATYGDYPLSPGEVQRQADGAKIDYDKKEAALSTYLLSSPSDQLTRQVSQKKQQIADLVAAGNRIDRLLADSKSLRTRLSTGTSSNSRGDELASLLLEVAAFNTWADLSENSPANLSVSAPAGATANLPVNLQIPIEQLSTGATSTEQLRNADALIATLESRQQAIQIDPLEQEVNQLQAKLEQETAKKQSLGQARDLAWSTYTTLASKVAEVTIAAQAQGTVVRQAVPAVPPDQPSESRKAVTALLAGAVGLLLAVGTAVLIEYLRDTIRTEEEMETLLKLPTVGMIPELRSSSVKGEAQSGRAALAVLDPRSVTAEAFRLVRYSLWPNYAKGEGKTENAVKSVLITSAVPSEGKSTIAANLAVSLACSGKRVMIVDANLRHPAQHSIFGLKNSGGLANILSEPGGNWETYAQATEVQGLNLIASGPPAADPAQLLERPAFGELMKQLKTRFEVVIIDTPAVLGLADVKIAAHLTDGILMAVAADRVARRDAVRAEEILSATGVPIAGAVMNRATGLPAALKSVYYTGTNQDRSGWWIRVRDQLADWVGPHRGN